MKDVNIKAINSAIANYFIDAAATAYYCDMKEKTVKVLNSKGLKIKEASLADKMTKYPEGLIYYVKEYVHPDDRDRMLEMLEPDFIRKVLAENDQFTFDYKGISSDGIKKFRSVLLRGEDDDHVLLIFWNITEDTEETIREAREFYPRNEIFSQMFSDDGVFLIDCVNNTRKTIHDHCYGGSNYNDSDGYLTAIGKYVDTFVSEVDREMMREVTDPAYMLNRVKNEREFSVRYRDTSSGTQRFFEMRVVAFSDTEILQGFKEKDKEIINQLILEKIEDDYFALMGVDLDSGLAQILKKSPEYPLGEVGDVIPYTGAMRGIASHLSGEAQRFFDRISDINYLKRKFMNEDKASFTYKSPLGDGKRWVNVTERVLARNEKGEPSLFALELSLLDNLANEKEELRSKLQEALAMAQSANRAKTAFLNNMSHDIRTPMNAIIGYTTLAKKHMDNLEQVEEYLEKISKSSDHLLSLINDVLDMSRIEAGKLNLDAKEDDLMDIVHNLRDIIQADMNAKQHMFCVEMVNVNDKNVVCDRLRLIQVLLNIVSNSIKYTDNGGTITLKITEKPAKLSEYATFEFCIKDNGKGMSPEYLKTIFDPFTREKTSTISGIQGTGLGMAITKNLTEMMGGMIEITSELGEGTETVVTFDFKVLDKKVGGIEELNIVAKEEDEFDFEGKRLLLVEDNEINREIALELLKEEGFIVDTAEDGDIAVEMMKRALPGDYDAILMDIQMPRMNGYEATKQIRELGTTISRIPIIATTANAFEEDRRAAIEAGMDAHVAKPVNLYKLRETLAQLLG